MYKKLPTHRYKKTLEMLKEVCPAPAVIFDLGVRNPFSEIMKQNNYKVYNTGGEDFDDNPSISIPEDVDLVTGFEIIEHLISPYPMLKTIKAKRIFLTVPIKLWFSKAYKSKTDPRDRHYHEFEPWQFDWLLEKSGWKIIKKEYWKNPSKKIGFRPLLRNFTNRYYAVYAERSMENYTNYYKGVLNL
tara:strand:- start:56 stop:616 length:561 start_codon:yes stop_codon:yes gene_type:complete